MRTRICTGVVAAVFAAILVAPAFSAGTAGGPPKDVKGWRGTEWGMSPQQVATIIKVPPFEPTEDERDKTRTKYTLPKFSVDGSVAEVVLYFGESGSSGLTSVSLYFSDRSFRSVVDELKGNYGSPIMLKGAQIQAALWSFPRTKINCMSLPQGTDGKPYVVVQYTPNRKSPS